MRYRSMHVTKLIGRHQQVIIFLPRYSFLQLFHSHLGEDLHCFITHLKLILAKLLSFSETKLQNIN